MLDTSYDSILDKLGNLQYQISSIKVKSSLENKTTTQKNTNMQTNYINQNLKKIKVQTKLDE